MFVGHYGVSYLVKAKERAIPLWLLFVAVQLVDVVWAVLVMLGVEKVRIVPGITATNPLDLYYMPYTHSLIATAVWFGLAFGAYRVWAGRTAAPGARVTRAAVLVGVAVASHWFLDLLVHRPDLPLYDDAYKVGLGLWNYAVPAFLLEVLFLFGGMALYLRATTARSPAGRWGMPVFGLVMVALQASVFFGPPPPSPAAIAGTALGSYVLLAALVAWLERTRA